MSTLNNSFFQAKQSCKIIHNLQSDWKCLKKYYNFDTVESCICISSVPTVLWWKHLKVLADCMYFFYCIFSYLNNRCNTLTYKYHLWKPFFICELPHIVAFCKIVFCPFVGAADLDKLKQIIGNTKSASYEPYYLFKLLFALLYLSCTWNCSTSL